MSSDEVLSPFSAGAVEHFMKQRNEDGRKSRVREICACGHSMNFHIDLNDGSGRFTCKPGQQICSCVNRHAVLRADNLRLFMHSTTGIGVDHALGKGIMSCLIKDAGFEWIENPLACDGCQGVMAEPIPIGMDARTGRIRKIASGEINLVVCKDCYLNRFSQLG